MTNDIFFKVAGTTIGTTSMGIMCGAFFSPCGAILGALIGLVVGVTVSTYESKNITKEE